MASQRYNSVQQTLMKLATCIYSPISQAHSQLFNVAWTSPGEKIALPVFLMGRLCTAIITIINIKKPHYSECDSLPLLGRPAQAVNTSATSFTGAGRELAAELTSYFIFLPLTLLSTWPTGAGSWGVAAT